MSTLGWILILFGGLLIRQTYKGRVTNLGEDLSDAFIAISSGDNKALTAVLARTGDNNIPNVTVPITPVVEGQVGTIIGQIEGSNLTNPTILRSAKALGSAAKGYRFGASGPDYYDCSGLMWRACQKAGFKGIRFTTFTVQAAKGFNRIPDSDRSLGDIVLWPTHHMGVVSGDGLFYSARSPKSGIGETKIAGFRTENPIYLRYTP